MNPFGNVHYLLLVLVIYTCSLPRIQGGSISNPALINDKIERKHVGPHVASMIGSDSAEKMDDRKFRFYYFQMHDENGDKLLDGSELIQSVIHFYDEMKHDDDNGDYLDEATVYSDDIFARSVDSLLEEHDTNNDGLLDYLEFTINAPLVFSE